MLLCTSSFARPALAVPRGPRTSAVRPGGLRCRPPTPPGRRHTLLRAGGEKIPGAVIEAEKKSSPGRSVRLVIYTFAAAAAGIVTLDQVGGVIGLLDVVLPSPFESEALGILTNAAVASGAVLLRQQEIETRLENQQRIWDEVQRRKKAGTLGKGPGAEAIGESASFADLLEQSVTKGKGKGKGGGQKGNKGFGGGAAPQTVQKKEEPAKEEEKGGQGSGGGAGGMLGGVKDLWRDANTMGRAQAMAINDKLEEAGVIEPLKDQNLKKKGEGGGESKP